jgi:hypothetical protein
VYQVGAGRTCLPNEATDLVAVRTDIGGDIALSRGNRYWQPIHLLLMGRSSLPIRDGILRPIPRHALHFGEETNEFSRATPQWTPKREHSTEAFVAQGRCAKFASSYCPLSGLNSAGG